MSHPSPNDTYIQQCKTLVEAMQHGVFSCNAAGLLTFVNPAMTKLLECPASTLIGQSLADIVAPENLAILNDFFDKVTTQYACLDQEIRVIRGTGTCFWGQLVLTPSGDSQFTGVLHNINCDRINLAQFNQQTTMEHERQQTCLAVQVPHVSIGCICLDESFRVRSWNSGATCIFGFSEHEMAGRELSTVMPEEIQLLISQVRDRVHNGEDILFSAHSSLIKDGQTILCSWTFSLLRNEVNHSVGILCLVEDITLRTKNEKLLAGRSAQLEAVSAAIIGYLREGDWSEASRHLLHSALAHTQSQYGFVGVITPGPILRILCHEGITWGPENMEFFLAAKRTYQEIGYLEFSAFDNLFGRVITGGEPILSNDPANDSRAAHRLPAGHPPLRNFLGVPIRHGNQVVGLMGVANHPQGYTPSDQELIQTLTEAAGVLYYSYRQQEQSRVLTAEKESLLRSLHRVEKLASLGILLGGVAHELNNPLFIAKGFIRLARESLQGGEIKEADGALMTVETTLGRASDILARFLLSTRQGAPSGEKCSPNKVLSETLAMLSNTLLIKQIDVDRSLAPDLPDVVGSGQDLTHVFMNLFTNAFQALENMPVKKTICVSSRLCASKESPYIEVVISDNGPGIPEETLPYIFDPFFTTKPVGQGTGLGLYICHQIINRMDGAITCHSSAGKGSTFTVTLKACSTSTPALQRVTEREKESNHG